MRNGRAGGDRSIQRRIVAETLTPPPARLGVTHWSSRLLAKRLGTSHVTIAEAWKRYGVKPWKAETFKFSTDPELEAKVSDVIGLYLAPPENAIVLCVDEKVPDPGVEPDPEDLADAARPRRAAHPRLRPARHHHLVRRAGDRDREGHRALQEPAPAPGVPRLPQACRPRLPRPRAAPGDGQLCGPQAPQREGMARRSIPASTSTSPRPPGPG